MAILSAEGLIFQLPATYWFHLMHGFCFCTESRADRVFIRNLKPWRETVRLILAIMLECAQGNSHQTTCLGPILGD